MVPLGRVLVVTTSVLPLEVVVVVVLTSRPLPQPEPRIAVTNTNTAKKRFLEAVYSSMFNPREVHFTVVGITVIIQSCWCVIIPAIMLEVNDLTWFPGFITAQEIKLPSSKNPQRWKQSVHANASAALNEINPLDTAI